MPTFGEGHIQFTNSLYIAVAESPTGPLHIYPIDCHFVDRDGWTSGFWTGVPAHDDLLGFTADSGVNADIPFHDPALADGVISHFISGANKLPLTLPVVLGLPPVPGWYVGTTNSVWSLYGGTSGVQNIAGEYGVAILVVLGGGTNAPAYGGSELLPIFPPISNAFIPMPFLPPAAPPDVLTLLCPLSPVVHVPYLTQLLADGTPPLTFSLAGGSLPPGISLDATGLLFGTTDDVGHWTAIFHVVDRYGFTGTSTCVLTTAGIPLPNACDAVIDAGPSTAASTAPTPLLP